MASKVLKSFLIGIGYDTKALEAGDKKIGASLNGIKSNALGISAALVGAFGAGASAIVGVANRVDKLAMSTQNLRTSQAAVYNYGNALKLMGGDAADAVETLAHFEEIQNNLRLKGDAGPINDLATAGIDVSSLYQTNTGEEFMRALADMIPKLDEGQRAQVQSSLGLSDGVFRSLAGGVEKLDETMKRANALTGSVDQLTENSRKLADNSAQLGLIIEGVKNELADKFLPSLIGATAGVNNFLKEYRPEISKGVDALAENPQATAGVGVGAAAAVAGAGLSKIGLTGLGGALKGAGQIGMAISLADLMTPYIDPMFDKLFGVDRAKSDVYSGQVQRTQEDVDYLDRRDGAANEVRYDPDSDMFGHRSASDSMPPTSGTTPEEDRQASAEVLAGVLARTPINVKNQLGITLELDGQALETKINQVNERQNYETLGDLKTTTER
ncbi:hypothetical protein IQK56_07440 [Pseudomonas sp. MAFF 301449]|uniref:Tail tape measure protein n=1 Tax=Pseudomonas cyclaminis TaxID=2781239 RepID=A0ABR9SR24_9PSED|nr:hypothetical protein [Pseudomonas cyclaminis]MBE8590779.1 hypothetical protein [Pseudomonas cyclaminis]MBE8598720.1 hypothetical protein [Pseudomonas cyclaminis]